MKEVACLTRIIAFLFILGIILSNNQIAFADEGHGHNEDVKEATDTFRNGSDTSQGESKDNAKSNSNEGMDHDSMTEAEHHDSIAEEEHSSYEATHDSMTEAEHSEYEETHNSMTVEEHHDSMTEEEHGSDEAATHDDSVSNEEGGGHGHGDVKETQPNYKILGTYGAVNASFILIGIWNKWIRRKGV